MKKNMKKNSIAYFFFCLKAVSDCQTNGVCINFEQLILVLFTSIDCLNWFNWKYQATIVQISIDSVTTENGGEIKMILKIYNNLLNEMKSITKMNVLMILLSSRREEFSQICGIFVHPRII